MSTGMLAKPYRTLLLHVLLVVGGVGGACQWCSPAVEWLDIGVKGLRRISIVLY